MTVTDANGCTETASTNVQVIAPPELARAVRDRLEKALLTAINKTGIGPQGLGGRVTSLAVHIRMMPCHIASLPLAININCHASRHQVLEL